MTELYYENEIAIKLSVTITMLILTMVVRIRLDQLLLSSIASSDSTVLFIPSCNYSHQQHVFDFDFDSEKKKLELNLETEVVY